MQTFITSKLTEYIKTGKYMYLDVIPDFRDSEKENIIKKYRQADR